MADKHDKTVFNYSAYDTAGWGKRSAFSEDDIDQIKSDLKPGKRPKVAVPSPFARLELMQKAFGNVAAKGSEVDLRDLVLVSNALDVFQLIFEGHTTDSLDIVEWDLVDNTDELIRKGSKERSDRVGMRLYGKTLKDYAEIEKYGLSRADQIDGGNVVLYLLRHNEDVLGMTSPTSVFMPTPNPEDGLWKQYTIEGNIPVFSKIRHLYQRPKDFIVFVYRWIEALKRKNDGEIPHSLDLFDKYLVNQREKLAKANQAIYDLIATEELRNSSLDSYGETVINGKGLSVLGFPMYSIKASEVNDFIQNQSDLTIEPTLNNSSRPLVLSTSINQASLKYTSDSTFWDSKKSGLDYTDEDLWGMEFKQRLLPNGIEYKHGFISEHDLLSDQIWQLPYNLNDNPGEDGKFLQIEVAGKVDGISYLPPVTPLFFEFFTVEDLQQRLKLAVKTKNNGEISNVTAILTVPVRGGEVKFKKVYWPLEPEETIDTIINENLNLVDEAKGHIMSMSTALSIFPFVKFTDEALCDYAFQLVRETVPGITSELGMSVGVFKDGFYQWSDKEGSELDLKESRRRLEDEQATVVAYSLRKSAFDIIKLKFTTKNFQSETFLMPRWGKPYEGGHFGLNFSFDFGTSNTYVAVKKQGTDENLEFTLPMKLLASTVSKDSGREAGDITLDSFNGYSEQELLPYSRFKQPFPLASVLIRPRTNNNIGTGADTDYGIPFLHNSIPFVYGFSDYGSAFNDVINNLKWKLSQKKDQYGNPNEDAKHVPAFINELMALARAYAVDKGAKLSLCHIVWTYPLSMPQKEFNKLPTLWEDAYRQYFNPNYEEDKNTGMVSNMPESIAPILPKLSDLENIALSIDIGGGTCDAVIYEEDRGADWKILSFRFGAETLFGLEEKNAKGVPMISNALNDIRRYLATTPAVTEGERMKFRQVADQLPKESASVAEVTRALFALEGNSALKKLGDSVSFNKWLQARPEYHPIFYYYYAAIIYYMVKVMESIGMEEMPEKVFFSGSGSKILHIISDGNRRVLTELTTKMFETFSTELESEEDEVWVVLEKEPKKVTAYGALTEEAEKLAKNYSTPAQARKLEIKHFLIDSVDSQKKPELKLGDLEEDEIMEEAVKSIVTFNEAFLKFVNKSGAEFEIDTDAVESFMDSMKARGEWSEKKIKKYIRKAVDLKNGDLEESYPDAPFFAGLRRIIYKYLTKSDNDD